MSNSSIEIKWNWKGWDEVRKRSDVKALLLEHANKTASAAGEGYKVIEYPSRVVVVAYTDEAQNDNLKNNTLLKARR